MKYNKFENQINKHFVADSAPVDTDALLAALGLDTEETQTKPFPWWILGIALITLVLIAGWINNQNKIETSIATVESQSSINQQIIQPTKKLTNINSEEESIINNDSAIMSTSFTIAKATNNTEKTTKLSSSDVTTIARTIQQKPNSILQPELTKPIFKSTVNNKITKINNEINSTTNKPFQGIEELRKVNPLPSIADMMMQKIKLPIRKIGTNGPECPSFGSSTPWHIALLAEVGVMKPMKELQSVNGDTAGAFDLRNNNENSKEAIQIGLYTKVSKGKSPFYLRAGAAYTRIAEQMNEKYNYTERDTTKGIISITTSASGDTITAIYGDIVTEKTFSGNSRRHYFVQLWDIPVAIGYEWQLGNSFYFGGEAGAQINISTGGSGLILRDINEYTEFSETVTNKTKVGMSYFGGLHIGKHISPRSSVQLSARMRYYPDHFSSVDPNIQQRYSLAGVHAGYVWRF